MVQKAKGQKVYKTMQGKMVDMDMLRKKNELTQAVGNAKVNARGDELGPGGKIIKKREDVVKEYYESHQGVVDEPAVKEPEKDLTDDWEEPAPVKETTKAKTRTTTKSKVEVEDERVEDEDGNFVKKGD